jgi:hypothetical protein
MKAYGFYLNAEKLILAKEFNNLRESDSYCKENYPSIYWNIEIRKIQ